MSNKFKIIYTKNIRYNAIKAFVTNDNHTEYVICGPAFRYTQVLLAMCCNEVGKKLHIYTARLNYDSTIDLTKQYKCVTLNDKYQSLQDAWVDARKCAEDKLLWTDNHIPFMVDYLRIPSMSTCWAPFGTGPMLTALLQANPNTVFKCVDMHFHPGLNMAKFNQSDHKRILSTVAWQEIPRFTIPYHTNQNYEGRIWYYASKKGIQGEYIIA